MDDVDAVQKLQSQDGAGRVEPHQIFTHRRILVQEFSEVPKRQVFHYHVDVALRME